MYMAYLKQRFLNRFRNINDVVAQYDYVSFDVFDTLIIRKCGHPHNIFDIVADKYNVCKAGEGKINDYRRIRVEAEASARRNSKNEEVTLDEIYNVMPLREEVKVRLQKIEELTEIEQCVIREEIVNIYNRCIEEGKTVYITSDMYLKDSVLFAIFQNNGIKYPKKLFLSSNLKKTKRKGSLFDEVIRYAGTSPNKILHIGDNLISDFARPLLKGLSTYWLNKV